MRIVWRQWVVRVVRGAQHGRDDNVFVAGGTPIQVARGQRQNGVLDWIAQSSSRFKHSLDGKTFTAATFAFYIRIGEFKAFIESFFDEVKLCSF